MPCRRQLGSIGREVHRLDDVLVDELVDLVAGHRVPQPRGEIRGRCGGGWLGV